MAEAIFAIMPVNTGLFHVNDAPAPEEYDFLLLGFWTSKSAPDLKMQKYMAKVENKQVALFGTMAAYPDSAYALKVKTNAEALLKNNCILGTFLCQGRLAQKRFEKCMSQGYQSQKHPMTEERRERIMQASLHPNDQDYKNAQNYFQNILETLQQSLTQNKTKTYEVIL